MRQRALSSPFTEQRSIPRGGPVRRTIALYNREQFPATLQTHLLNMASRVQLGLVASLSPSHRRARTNQIAVQLIPQNLW
jgi:hypothetical protein